MDLGSLSGEETVLSRAIDADERDSVTSVPIAADIILISHPDAAMLGRRFQLPPQGTLNIGRSSAADVSLPNVASMSRLHARLRHWGLFVEIEDLHSTNGTYVNDARLERAQTLQSGDRFRVGAAHFKFLHEEDPENAYHQAMMTDGLTRAFNKRKFDEEFHREVERGRRHERPLSLILFDIDHFKTVNDTHGHRCGDVVLQHLARHTSHYLRPEQIFARVGGEEFAVLCPETELKGAAVLAEKLRQSIAEEVIPHEGLDLRVTCSFGVATFGENAPTTAELYEAADQALYEAKDRGRNRVEVAGNAA